MSVTEVERFVESPQEITVSRDGLTHDAIISWEFRSPDWVVTLTSRGFGTAQAHANDAFEAQCLVREELEPYGWRVGITGALEDVWPSGMARDQGGGLRAYTLLPHGPGELVDTFAPVDPASVATVAEQRARYDRWWQEVEQRNAAKSREVGPR